MTAMMAMEETATAAATAMGMMPPLLPTATMSMRRYILTWRNHRLPRPTRINVSVTPPPKNVEHNILGYIGC